MESLYSFTSNQFSPTTDLRFPRYSCLGSVFKMGIIGPVHYMETVVQIKNELGLVAPLKVQIQVLDKCTTNTFLSDPRLRATAPVRYDKFSSPAPGLSNIGEQITTSGIIRPDLHTTISGPGAHELWRALSSFSSEVKKICMTYNASCDPLYSR